ncbi:hypothetical protein RA307_27705 [Xanthobacteraceae bacterium Astr-EGSB]|uniref:hypothetical protein n=1 Tax=Astrobacterium formosum TaxID=3069710 RepID=UPI0027B72F7C|nr:hypothetical protein [Xanthobacteraceae bacterium Astr-EGSB]
MPEARQHENNYAITLRADAEAVFPLLCPVREYDWIPDWECELIHSRSGVIEPGCIFRTHHGGVGMTWYVTEHDPARFRVAFVQFMAGIAVGHFSIALAQDGPGRTSGTVRSVLTALPEAGPAFDGFAVARDAGLHRLEGLLNAYLDHNQEAAAR